jgi:outer membrane biosynthesis protein TonB
MGADVIFCQSCGGRNTGAARFCNMCGAPIAVAGAPGGPVDDASAVPTSPDPPPQLGGAWDAPSGESAHASGTGGLSAMNASMTGVTLARIGVRSSKRIWMVLALISIGLIGLGALSTWLVTRGEGGSEDGGHAQADDPFVIGTPLPRGAETPAEDFLSAKPTPGETTPADREAPRAPGPSARDTASRGASGASGGGARAPRAPAESPSKGQTSAGASGERSGAAPDTDREEGGGPSGDKGAPAERDIAMDMYGARVRYAVQRYYAPRAQGCFDRATRNHPSLSGTVVVGLSIGADGQVTAGSVVRNTTGDAELGACLAGQVRSWKLPPPPDGSLEMEMPFSR